MLLDPVTMTMSALLDLYEQEYLPHKALKYQYQQRLTYRWIRQELGDIPVQALTPARLRRWRDALAMRYKASTVNRYLYAASAPLTVAVRDYGFLAENPLRKVQKPSEPPGRIRFLSPDERNALLLACEFSMNRHLYPIVLLALTTGARKNELRGLRWRDVDVQAGYARLLQTKNKQPRTIPLVEQARVLLAKRQDGATGNPWLFPRPDGQQPVLIEHAWQTARRRAGLTDFRFHDLRHTAASYLAMSGASLLDMATILGHTSLTMVKRYAHLSFEHTAQVTQRMADQFFPQGM